MAGGYIIGMDYGTDSVRTVIVDGETGEEISSHVSKYKMWGEGRYCDPSKNQFRQHPKDYIDGLVESVLIRPDPHRLPLMKRERFLPSKMISRMILMQCLFSGRIILQLKRQRI